MSGLSTNQSGVAGSNCDKAIDSSTYQIYALLKIAMSIPLYIPYVTELFITVTKQNSVYGGIKL